MQGSKFVIEKVVNGYYAKLLDRRGDCLFVTTEFTMKEHLLERLDRIRSSIHKRTKLEDRTGEDNA